MSVPIMSEKCQLRSSQWSERSPSATAPVRPVPLRLVGKEKRGVSERSKGGLS